MKNSLFLAIICLLTCSSYVFTASADNYFTLRTATDTIVNDTLRINPNWAGGFCKMYVPAHFDGRLDHWYLKMVHPGNMSVYDGNIVDLKVAVGPAMTIEYLDQNGEIDWLLNGISVTDPYILAAADVDGDGVVEVSDISTLIDMIMNM